MIALIPGLTAALASLQPQPSASPTPQEGFPQLLNSASQSLPSAETPTPAAPPRYEVQPGDSLTAIAKKLGYDDPTTLAQANHLKDPDRLQVGQVLTLPENTRPLSQPGPTKLATPAVKPAAGRSQAAAALNSPKGRRQLVAASWYGSQHHGKLMANGQPFNMYSDTVAHKSLPLGTRLTLTNPQNGNAVRVKVTDRGPYVSGRSLDLSYGAASKLGVLKNGVSKVWMEGG
jgi:rare lipoprotein A